MYSGRGVDYRSSFNTRVALSSIYGCIEFINADQIKEGAWHEYTSMIAFPGGEASPYNEDLGIEGMESIREFIRKGGVYLGCCGGAYFTAQESEFGGKYGLPKINKAHLGLYENKVIGPLFGCIAGRVKVIVACADGVSREAFSEGGGVFKEANLLSSTTILGNYQYWGKESNEAAFVKVNYGQGLVFASFVHFESPEVWESWRYWLKEQIDLESHLKNSDLLSLQY